MKPLVLILISLLAITGAYLGPGASLLAHAAGPTGEVCIVQTSDVSLGCPGSAPTIAGPLPGPGVQFSLAVLVNGSATLIGFDITVVTNSSVLQPADAILGTVNIGKTQVLVKCVGGSNKLSPGSPCPSYATAANTLDYSVVGDTPSTPPVTGLLFTAVFNVVGVNSNTPIVFQTGCGSSTSVPNGVCITISSGTTVPQPETSLTAKFSNTPYFNIFSNIGFLKTSEGDTNTTAFLTIASLNGFGGSSGATVTLAASSSPTGPIVTFTPYTSVKVTSGGQNLTGITVNVPKTLPPGNYTLTITGTTPGLPPNSITIQLDVPVPDFSVTANPSVLIFNVTVPKTSQITISSIGNYAANVNVTMIVPQGVQALLSNQKTSQILALPAGSTVSTILTARSSIAGGYTITINATSTSGTHLALLTLQVLDYSLQASAGTLNVVKGQNNTQTIQIIASSILYNTTVTINRPIFVAEISSSGPVSPTTGIIVSCSPTQLKIISTGNTKGENVTACHVEGVSLGDYVVIVTVTSGRANLTSTHAISFPVTVVAPNFSVVLPSTVPTVSVSSSTSVAAKITSNFGLVDNITMDTLTIDGGGLTPVPGLSANASIVHLTANHNTTLTVTITTSPNTPPGYYTLTVGGSSKSGRSTPTTAKATMTIIVVAIASPHNLGVMNVSPSATTATIGSNINITIEVVNLGKLPENATVIALAGDLTVGTANVTNLQMGTNMNVTIVWHTSGFNPGSYIIGGKVLTAPGQNNVTYSLIRYASPITLNPSTPPPFQYTLIIAIIAIVIVAAGIGLFLLQRRKPVTTA